MTCQFRKDYMRHGSLSNNKRMFSEFFFFLFSRANNKFGN